MRNSYSCAQSSSAKLRTNDQFLSLTDQLNLGVRAVELDTHWVEARLHMSHPSLLLCNCHPAPHHLSGQNAVRLATGGVCLTSCQAQGTHAAPSYETPQQMRSPAQSDSCKKCRYVCRLVQGELRIAHCGGFHAAPFNVLVKAVNLVASLLGHPIHWDTETVGCNPSLSSIPVTVQRSLADALAELAAWLAVPGNEEEFLLVFLDDQPDIKSWVRGLQPSFDASAVLLWCSVKSSGGRVWGNELLIRHTLTCEPFLPVAHAHKSHAGVGIFRYAE